MEDIIDIADFQTEALQTITHAQAWFYSVVPHRLTGERLLLLADREKWRDAMQDELEVILGREISVEVRDTEYVTKLLSKFYREGKAGTQTLTEFKAERDFLSKLIQDANAVGSSDIHLESYEEKCRIRIRIDGKLSEKYVIGRNDYPALINKIKIKARLDISEKRLPQDGRMQMQGPGGKYDIRVSIIPTLHGEKIVMRLLGKDTSEIDINRLGFTDRQLQDFKDAIKRPYGLVLISGPTGSGKTTTLYASLKILNRIETNIITIEDPIEYTLDGINQVQLKEGIGLGFAEALRAFLRQDPDIIMLGEIRDKETAQMSIRAALTGHLVLATIHTNTAWGTVSRLIDMGVPAYLISSTLNITVAQRLVRILCSHCKKNGAVTGSQLPLRYRKNNLKTHYYADGCEQCHYSGYSGRKAIYEVIPLDNETAELVRSDRRDIDEVLQRKGITRLPDQAFHLLEQGYTSLEEVYSILSI